MAALLVVAMASPLWVGFGVIGWQLVRAARRLHSRCPVRNDGPDIP